MVYLRVTSGGTDRGTGREPADTLLSWLLRAWEATWLLLSVSSPRVFLPDGGELTVVGAGTRVHPGGPLSLPGGPACPSSPHQAWASSAGRPTCCGPRRLSACREWCPLFLGDWWSGRLDSGLVATLVPLGPCSQGAWAVESG